MPEIDTTNDFLVGMRGGGVCVMNPPRSGEIIDNIAALRLAAWLVALAEGRSGLKFEHILEAVESC